MVTEIVSTITEMVTGLLGGLGNGIVEFFEALFVTEINGVNGISTLGIWVIALIGLAVALGAVAWVATLIRGKQR